MRTKIKPINWEDLDKSLRGEQMESAIKVITKNIISKVNELVEAINGTRDGR